MVFADLLEQLRRRQDLSGDQAAAVMGDIMDGNLLPTQIAGFLMALAVKGETAMELVGFARTMRARAVPMPVAVTDVFDTCGTGGDGARTFNVSTATAIVMAGAGVRVAKHGNRAVSSRSGSADVFEALGVRLDASADRTAEALEAGLAFFFAPAWHPSMRHAGPARKELGVRTAFNLLGPLCNPAGARRQIVGVPREAHTELIGTALAALGSEHAWVVHGAGGLDELSTLGPTTVVEVMNGALKTFQVDPRALSLPPAKLEDLSGGSAGENAEIITRILDGESGPRRDVVVLNAGAGLVVAGRAAELRDGMKLAEESLVSGRARQALDRLRSIYARSDPLMSASAGPRVRPWIGRFGTDRRTAPRFERPLVSPASASSRSASAGHRHAACCARHMTSPRSLRGTNERARRRFRY
jgi:anthranilate phosphoribosyltransferase